jgi:hypothetical protein
MYDEETVKMGIVAAIIFSRDPAITVEESVSKAESILQAVAELVKAEPPTKNRW